MANVSSVTGASSYLDIQKLVEQSLVRDRQSISYVEAKKEEYSQAQDDWAEIKNKLLSFKSILTDLKSPNSFFSRITSSSDSDIVTATASTDAALTSYSLTDITLAQAAQQTGADLKLNDSSGYDGTKTLRWSHETIGTSVDPNIVLSNSSNNIDLYDKISSGSITVNGATISIDVDNDTLYEVASKINASSADVEATFTLDYFVLTSRNDGDTEITVSDPGNTGFWDAFKFDQTAPEMTEDKVLLSSGEGGDYITLVPGQVFDHTGDVVLFSPTDKPYDPDDSGWRGLATESGSPAKVGAYVSYKKYDETSYSAEDQAEFLDGTVGFFNEGAVWLSPDNLLPEEGIYDIKIGIVDEAGNRRDYVYQIEYDLTDSIDALSSYPERTATQSTTVDLTGISGKDPFWEQTIEYVQANHSGEGADETPIQNVTDGYFNINDITFNVDISEDSIQDILNRINNSSAGVSAFYDNDLDKITLTAKETGENITFDEDTSGFLEHVMGVASGEGTATFTAAEVTVNGTTITPDGNTFTLNGTTFTLHANSTTGATVEVNRDTDTAKAKIEKFIDGYNELNELMEEKTASGEALQNERLISNIQRQLREYVLDEVTNPGEYDFLRDIGIEYNAGSLSLDSSKLSDAFLANPDSVAELFAFDTDNDGVRDDGGVANDLIINFVTGLTLSSTGDISERISFLDTKIDRVDDDIEKLEERTAKKELSLWEEYIKYANAIRDMEQMFQIFNAQMQSLNKIFYSSSSTSSLLGSVL